MFWVAPDETFGRSFGATVHFGFGKINKPAEEHPPLVVNQLSISIDVCRGVTGGAECRRIERYSLLQAKLSFSWARQKAISTFTN
jgi:hypothetical protein